MRVLVIAIVVASLTSLAAVCSAQDYSDWSVTGSGGDKNYSIGFQLGLPLVAGVDISGQLNQRFSVSLGFGFVPDLIALGGQLRMNVLEPGPDKIVPIVGVGLNQYWLEDDGENTDAVAAHLLVGGQRMFGSNYALGLHLGYIATLSESTASHVSVWGVNDDMSKLFLGVEGRYFF
ncbi:MAG: hypothetical protein NTX17_08775 [Candidatus Eisenbacteria bacterium]|nr:hypothetical protein [Candidatus Eisenbacteria bacterium]